MSCCAKCSWPCVTSWLDCKSFRAHRQSKFTMTLLGIDIGGTSVKLAAIEDGRTLWTGQSPFYSRPTTQELIDAISAAADNRPKDIAVAGLCVPGLYDKERRMITLSVNVPGLMNIVLDDL